jgi:hypothetical protein
MQWILIIVALILAVPTYGISLIFLVWYMFKTGGKRRKEILNKLILNAYKDNEGEIITTDLVYFEAAMKFAEENSNSTPYKSNKNNIVFRYSINDELLSIHFSKGFNGELIYSVKRLSENQNFANNESSHRHDNYEEVEQAIDKYSDKQILTTSYNMIKELIDEQNNKPLANNAPFLDWEDTINLLKKDNGEALIELEDGTGYLINFEDENVIYIVKEKEGYPIFTNQKFYEKYYNAILDTSITINNKNKISYLEEFKKTLPLMINDNLELNQILNDDNSITLMFFAPKRGTIEDTYSLMSLIKEKMIKEDFINKIKEMGFNINFQILASNYQHIATDSIYTHNNKNIKNDNSNDEEIKFNINKVIAQLNKARIDYDDILDVYHNDLIGDSYLTLEMANERDFSLNFENKNKMNIALNIIKYKMTDEIDDDYLYNYDLEYGLDNSLLDVKKMIFDDFMSQYELDIDEMDSLLEWREKNLEKKEEDIIWDFTNYKLSIKKINDLTIPLIYKND